MGNPKLLSGLQAEVVGDLWRGSSSSGSGVWEVAMRRVGGNLHLVRVSCISDPLKNTVPGKYPDQMCEDNSDQSCNTQGYPVMPGIAMYQQIHAV